MINFNRGSDPVFPMELHQLTEAQIDDDVSTVNTEMCFNDMREVLSQLSSTINKLTKEVNFLKQSKLAVVEENTRLKEESTLMLELKNKALVSELKQCRKKYSVNCRIIQDNPTLWFTQRIVKLIVNNIRKNNALKSIQNKYQFLKTISRGNT